ncbi:hypothetical protein CLIB1444_07S01332 [[Candida] jaroonii]|uniref:Uncharacterized protein n=1 Tax=[Candida] jaroonii TaxID=467808 RepID=A0ACA9Y9M0_9ASCO|nr:hypothetical protein CLIB1444_07S01332 [[Candida] jaroonii]
MICIGDCLTSSDGDLYQVTGSVGEELSVKLVGSNWSYVESVSATDIDVFNNPDKEFMDSLVIPFVPSQFPLQFASVGSESCDFTASTPSTPSTLPTSPNSKYFEILNIFEWKLVELKEKKSKMTTKQKKYHLKQFLNRHIKQSFKLKPFLRPNTNLPPSGKPMRLVFEEIINKGLNIRLVYFLCNNQYDSLLEFVLNQLIRDSGP